MDFLASHGFDFNKWIKEGISYLSVEQEKKLRRELANQQARNQETVALAPADETFVKGVLELIGKWVSEAENRTPTEPLNLPPVRFWSCVFLVDEAFPDISSLLLFSRQVSSYHRRLTFQEVSRRYPQFYLRTEQDPTLGFRFIRVSLMTEEQKAEKELEKRQQIEQELGTAVGFRKVIDALVASKKPIIGHNCFLDLLHLYHQFISTLPLSYATFKKRLNRLFPAVFDTKQLLHDHPKIQTMLGSTVLGEIHAKLTDLKLGLPVHLGESFNRYAESQDLHEAGADAYVTGMAFLGICELLSNNDLGSSSDSDNKHPHTATSPVIAKHVNRLHMMKIRGYMHLGQPDEFPERHQLVWLTGLTSEIRASDLVKHFSSSGKFRTHWIDESQCILEFLDATLKIDDIWINRANKDAAFRVRKISEFDNLNDIAEETDDSDEEAEQAGKKKRKRTDDDDDEHKAKRRRLSVGGVNCVIC